MSRRREYLKATQVDLSSLAVNFFPIKNENVDSDIVSIEIVDFAAKLFILASKRGRVNSSIAEVFDEAA